MVHRRLQKEWEREADKKFPEFAEIFKIFSDYYSPALIEIFFSATKEKASSVIGSEAETTKVLGLFTETWRLAIKKRCPPCGKVDFMSLLSESVVIWEKKGCKSATVKTLRKSWEDAVY